MTKFYQSTGSLAPGQSVDLDITISPHAVGMYQVTVDGLSGSFEVVPAPLPPISRITTGSGLSGKSFRRLTFYAHDLFCVFLMKDDRVGYTTSPTGITGSWATWTPVSIGKPRFFSLFFSSQLNCFDLCYSTSEDPAGIRYVRGYPMPDGTVILGAEWLALGAGSWEYGNNCIDSGGYPWLTNGGWAYKGNRNDGVWEMDPRFPQRLFGTDGEINTWRITTMIPMAGPEVVMVQGFWRVAYQTVATSLSLRKWDGEAWLGAVSFGGLKAATSYSVLSEGSKLHAVWNNTAMYYQTYSALTNALSSSRFTLAAEDSVPVLSKDGQGKLYAWWLMPAERILRVREFNESWLPTVNVVEGDVDSMSGTNRISAPYECHSSFPYCLWDSSNGVKFGGYW